MNTTNTVKKTALAVAMTAAMGLSATASADTINVSFDGLFTMLTADGGGVVNTDGAVAPWYGWRTPITGGMSFNTHTGAGTGNVNAFSFFGKGLAIATTITFQAIGNGFGGAGPLVAANMGFNWNTNNGIPVSLIMDGSGFFNTLGAGGLTTSSIISGGSLAATEGLLFGPTKSAYTLPMGPGPMVSTTWNTTTIGGAACTLGCNPSGTLPLIADTVGGSPMVAGPFKGFNANFDITSLHVSSIVTSAVPVPAAVWLFGSGLMGLVGVARRRKSV